MITKADVEHVAHLARLKLSEEEKEAFTRQLNAILEAAGKLQELNTEGVEPTAYAIPMQNVFRPDEVRSSLPRELVLANAPDVVNGMFRVPKIME